MTHARRTLANIEINPLGLKGLGIKTPTLSDVDKLNALKGSMRGQRAVLIGNGWRLRLAQGRIKPGLVTIGTNRAHECFPLDVHVSIDRSAEAPPAFEGIRFGAAREGRHPATLGACWSDYWKHNGALVKGTTPAFTGLYAIEVAVFLGFTEMYLLGYCGDDQPGSSGEGHFYAGKRCAPGMAVQHNAWIAEILKTHPATQLTVILVPNTPVPAIRGTGTAPLSEIMEDVK